MVRQSSDLATAQAGAAGFKKIGRRSSRSTSISKSNIGAMKRGTRLSNDLVKTFSKLESGVSKQAQKIPKLAQAIESRDIRDRTRFGGTR